MGSATSLGAAREPPGAVCSPRPPTHLELTAIHQGSVGKALVGTQTCAFSGRHLNYFIVKDRKIVMLPCFPQCFRSFQGHDPKISL